MSRRAVEFRALRDGDVDALLAEIRPADLIEGEALGGPGAVPGMIAQSVQASLMLWAIDSAEGIVALLGMAPTSMLSDEGMPWMVGTPRVESYRRALMREVPAYIGRMLAACPRLVNVVDARNAKAIAYLRHAGFTIHPPAPLGRAGEPFHLFDLKA